jgi:CRP-like cAMP-binding protein
MMLTILEKVDYLRKTSMFHHVPTESLARVVAIAQQVDFEARQPLFIEGEPADAMFVLLEGEVTLAGKPNWERTLQGPQVVGALSLLAGALQPESAVASQPVRALRIEQQDFYDAMAEDFHLTRGVLRALVGMAAGGAA